MLGTENCTKKKKNNHNGAQFKPEIAAAILYMNSPAKIPYIVVLRRLNIFSAQTDPAENRIVENWSQNCGIKCHLCWSGEKEIDCACVCGTESVFLLALLFLVRMCI